MKILILLAFLLSITVSGWAGNKGYITKETQEVMEKYSELFVDDTINWTFTATPQCYVIGDMKICDDGKFTWKGKEIKDTPEVYEKFKQVINGYGCAND